MDWKKTLIHKTATFQDAIKTIDDNQMLVAFVIDEEQKLLGMVTDRDIRRGLLERISLDAPVTEVLNTRPTTVSLGMTRIDIQDIFTQTGFRHLPVIDLEGKIVDVVYHDDLPKNLYQDCWIVLMVGGLGSRLAPLTEDCPKSMLQIGNKPLLETILENFTDYGFSNFFFSVNYKSEIIEDYFNDGTNWGVNIQYLREEKPLGTAGALSLLPDKPEKTFIVMNGDVLTKVNFLQLLEFHTQIQAKATMAVREYDYKVPYGVVDIDLSKYSINKISEKPVHRFLVNAGIYVMEPEILNMIPDKEFFDMPLLFEQLLQQKQNTSAFPIREYWRDIGHKEDLIQANGEFHHKLTTKFQ